MNKKCSKYEALFTFATQEELDKHLAECEECRLEQEKMDKVSDLISEVKFYYKSKEKSKKIKLRAVCAAIFLIFFGATFGVICNDFELQDALTYQEENLSAEDLGFPVDSYGLIMVDE